jgi:thiol-disulfide isomerase/thioredoxin
MSSSRTATRASAGGAEKGTRTTDGVTVGLGLAFAFAFAGGGCQHAPDDMVIGRSVRPEGMSEPIAFKLDSLDSREISTSSVAGKPTVVAFVTTWDLSSQVQIDYLVPMAKRDGSQVNYVMVALQEPQDREIVEVYAQHLGVPFPAAMADEELIAGGGVFGAVKAVPTTIILDRSARIVWRHVGIAPPEEIRKGLSGL